VTGERGFTSGVNANIITIPVGIVVLRWY